MGRKNSDSKIEKNSRPKRDRNDSSSSDSSIIIHEKIKKKLLKKLKKLKKKEKKKRKKLEKYEKKNKDKIKKLKEKELNVPLPKDKEGVSEKSKILTPMTKEEWEKLQSTFKKVYDEETGRMRLVKGTGEIVEECISRERQLQINKQATRVDGEYFQKRLLNLK